MIEKLTDLPDGVLGLRVGGRLTPQDYEDVITPMVAEAVREGGRLWCLIEIEDEFSGLTPPAVVDDVRLVDGRPHLGRQVAGPLRHVGVGQQEESGRHGASESHAGGCRLSEADHPRGWFAAVTGGRAWNRHLRRR